MEAVLRHSCPSDGITDSARLQSLRDLVADSVLAAESEIEAIGAYILPEFDFYGELVLAMDQPLAGLLVRGEGQSFSRRVLQLMGQWRMTDECKRLHVGMAEAFDHKRCFLKLEWRARGDQFERRMAVYYRRRPHVHDALKILAGFAGTSLPLHDFREIASLLGKDTVHFVSFTARPDQPLWYKFYFSQYLTPESYDAAQDRLGRAIRRFSAQPAVETRWLAYHDRLAPRHRDQTIFVSLAMSEDGTDSSIKIDYPDVPPTVAAGLLDGADLARAEERLRGLCSQAGRMELSYLGVRLGAEEKPILKGYADFL